MKYIHVPTLTSILNKFVPLVCDPTRTTKKWYMTSILGLLLQEWDLRYGQEHRHWRSWTNPVGHGFVPAGSLPHLLLQPLEGHLHFWQGEKQASSQSYPTYDIPVHDIALIKTIRIRTGVQFTWRKYSEPQSNIALASHNGGARILAKGCSKGSLLKDPQKDPRWRILKRILAKGSSKGSSLKDPQKDPRSRTFRRILAGFTNEHHCLIKWTRKNLMTCPDSFFLFYFIGAHCTLFCGALDKRKEAFPTKCWTRSHFINKNGVSYFTRVMTYDYT